MSVPFALSGSLARTLQKQEIAILKIAFSYKGCKSVPSKFHKVRSGRALKAEFSFPYDVSFLKVYYHLGKCIQNFCWGFYSSVGWSNHWPHVWGQSVFRFPGWKVWLRSKSQLCNLLTAKKAVDWKTTKQTPVLKLFCRPTRQNEDTPMTWENF